MIVVTRLMDRRGTVLINTYPLGAVELRSPRADTLSERHAIRASCARFQDEQPDECMRIATVVDATHPYEADAIAEERFEEALDLLAAQMVLSVHALLPAGFFMWPETGRIQPREPNLRGRHVGTSFRMTRDFVPQIDWQQFLLTREHNDLSQRLVRSYHWSRKAELEANRQLRVLFRWFAMEAIWTLSKDDDIVPRIMWSLGFPKGAGAALLSPAFTASLQNHPTYGAWKPQIEDRLSRMRALRNNSVHNGFRRQDISKTLLNEVAEITALACPRVQGLACAGIRAGLTSARDLYDYLPLLVEGDMNYINNAHGNVVFSLETRPRWLG